ncbi:23S rRNA (uracil(1939)-C(5))-methyltransferase RlmD [Marinococcus halophilus]|uniref:23S rRNA (Uracil-C(5))-methyltransferase RlmCD n=1 Tax=Marinococcus halophilus TaxID=1371 RepID=A0A510Y5L4_MARHA|nr:23S rRNA (uracil(1939)-C(5))-methyltransferase RlmD [Marinococcus halophilus]OZT79829.1 23S rRNA (uracil(1939)-C(5))-methyltransferase RlmD [Marinococcus halophilus]GEK58650.1 23S rRNA (uracil-C(5))-methyltransferase RlmCD [Marinococcus halophilus]
MSKQNKPEAPVEKNELIETTIEDLTHEGHGVGRVEGYALFIPYALPGERIQAKVIKTKKGYGFGKLITVLEESSERTEKPCPIYVKCGGCQLQHMTYEAQLHYKHKQVKDAFERIGGLNEAVVRDTIGMEDPWRYRNKAQVPIGVKEDGRLKAGFYQKRTHNIIDMDECIIQQKENDGAVQQVKDIASRFGMSAYDEESGRGFLRHVVTRYAPTTGQLMIVVITNGKKIPDEQAFIEAVRNEVKDTASIVQNVNTKRTNVIFGEKTKTLWGEDYIYDHIGGVKFAISARSFYQVNPVQTKTLYDKALEYADLRGHETVIDAYCGIGTISLFLAEKARQVYGVEVVPQAVSDAKRNAQLNHFDNVTFAAGKAEEVMPWWVKANDLRPDVVVVDPPRKGCDEQLLDTMLEVAPERIVYVSCNPATLARDLKHLVEGGYEVVEAQPVDMFPQTTHVEVATKLVKK